MAERLEARSPTSSWTLGSQASSGDSTRMMGKLKCWSLSGLSLIKVSSEYQTVGMTQDYIISSLTEILRRQGVTQVLFGDPQGFRFRSYFKFGAEIKFHLITSYGTFNQV